MNRKRHLHDRALVHLPIALKIAYTAGRASWWRDEKMEKARLAPPKSEERSTAVSRAREYHRYYWQDMAEAKRRWQLSTSHNPQ